MKKEKISIFVKEKISFKGTSGDPNCTVLPNI